MIVFQLLSSKFFSLVKILFIRVQETKLFNSDLFINDLNLINWERLYLIPYVHDAWAFFYTEFTKVVDKYAPWRTFKVKGNHLPWIDGNLINLFKQRDRAWNKYICTTQTRNAKACYYRNSFSSNFNNPKKFWGQMNSLLGKSSDVTVNMLVNNEITNNPSLICDAFSLHFSQIPQVQLPRTHPEL